ncbi:MAG: DUF2798 domain-containing protein [Moraxellaceae bacterium]|nr:MAG: DUF2798 domain-containing protein [Moraxellaceae bacterium]
MLNNLNAKFLNPAFIGKLPVRYTPFVFAFFMATIMAFLMCLVITAAGNSVGEDYFPKVIHAYKLAMPVAFVCILMVRPMVVRLVSLCVKN